MGNVNIRKWDERQGMPIEGYEKRINMDEVTGGEPVICRNPLKTVEELVEQNCNYIDGVINNVAPVTIVENFEDPELKKVSVMARMKGWYQYQRKQSDEVKTIHDRLAREII